MTGGWLRIWSVVVAASLAVLFAGAAGARSPAEDQYEAEPRPVAPLRAPELETRMGEQEASLRRRIEEVAEVGERLEEVRSRLGGARVRTEELRRQTLSLKREISAHRRALAETKSGYEEKARAAYRGDHLEGLASVLGGLLGSGDGLGAGDARLARILLEGRASLAAYEEAEQMLQNTLRQISQKREDYERAVEAERETAAELGRREEELDESIARISAGKNRTEARLRRLEAAERARVLRTTPATGAAGVRRGYELGIARREITASPVEPIPYKEYVRLYKESAKEYGFGEDWYVLAAVGKVESDHGANMGPSSAGALGPMQFLPSTWKTSGVDGDGDGKANIMDPEDAIPAAARYLRDGGAPGDWYRALYTYNHADWYVEKVLAVAEGYRRMEGDDRVGPYL